MDSLLTNAEKVPLSGDDLIQIANALSLKEVSWMLYDDLAKFDNIKDVFKNNIAIYVLLQIKNQETGGTESVGHWITMIYHKDADVYYYFDPYGLSISQELSLTHEPSTITRFTAQANFQVNNIKFQKYSDEVNTCGRHCVLRSVFFHLTHQQYNDKIMVPLKNKLNPDEVVSLICGLIAKDDRVLIAHFNKDQ